MQDTNIELVGEAEQYHLKALFILHEVQANKQVYGSNSALTGAKPANVALALQYINRSLEILPENSIYLNLKALLMWEGNGDKVGAQALLEKAAQINPRDIDIQNNLNAIKTSQCVVATAAFGSPLAEEVRLLRWWRDEVLLASRGGALFVRIYYRTSRRFAEFVGRHQLARRVVRASLVPIISVIKRKYIK